MLSHHVAADTYISLFLILHRWASLKRIRVREVILTPHAPLYPNMDMNWNCPHHHLNPNIFQYPIHPDPMRSDVVYHLVSHPQSLSSHPNHGKWDLIPHSPYQPNRMGTCLLTNNHRAQSNMCFAYCTVVMDVRLAWKSVWTMRGVSGSTVCVFCSKSISKLHYRHCGLSCFQHAGHKTDQFAHLGVRQGKQIPLVLAQYS